MNKLKLSYISPQTKLERVEIESGICSGSVYKPGTNQEITTNAQAYEKTWETDGDLTGETWGNLSNNLNQ